MPQITLPYGPNTTPAIQDGQVTDGDRTARNFYSPTSPPESFEVINGRVDSNNRDSSWTVDRVHIQRGALSGGGSVGGTANLDYFKGSFGDWTDPTQDPANDDKSLYQPIPGAAVQFYLPFDPSMVLFTWHVFIATEGIVEDLTGTPVINYAVLRLFIDGTHSTPQYFLAPPSDHLDASIADTHRVGSLFDRVWAGHHMMTTLTKGWHSASIRIAHNQRRMNNADGEGQVRVRVRGFDYVYFK